MPPEPGSAEDWLQDAKSDLAIAGVPLPKEARYEHLCFHTQQAAEKAIKAVLIYAGVEFPPTHDISTLVSLLPADLDVPADVPLCAGLTAYAVVTRYPGDRTAVTASGHREALDRAQAAVRWAESVIGE